MHVTIAHRRNSATAAEGFSTASEVWRQLASRWLAMFGTAPQRTGTVCAWYERSEANHVTSENAVRQAVPDLSRSIVPTYIRVLKRIEPFGPFRRGTQFEVSRS
jgi:hypothetical protein